MLGRPSFTFHQSKLLFLFFLASFIIHSQNEKLTDRGRAPMPGINVRKAFGLTTRTSSLLIATARAIAVCATLLLGSTAICAQQLSIRRYDISDGLAHNIITSVYQDAKGY